MRHASAALLLWASTAVAQSFAPVPAEMVTAGRLTDRVAGFSIQAPAGWTWRVADSGKGHMYVCRAEHRTLIFMITTEEGVGSVDDVLKSAVRSVEAAG